jgi:hypothetical protein
VPDASATPADTSTTSADPPAKSAESAEPAESDNAAANSTPHANCPPVSVNPDSAQPVLAVLTPGRADRILREQCPVCFGLEEWGRPLEEWVAMFFLYLLHF